jgi:hypothetical protein
MYRQHARPSFVRGGGRGSNRPPRGGEAGSPFGTETPEQKKKGQ